jgi:hypothetical protein
MYAARYCTLVMAAVKMAAPMNFSLWRGKVVYTVLKSFWQLYIPFIPICSALFLATLTRKQLGISNFISNSGAQFPNHA